MTENANDRAGSQALLAEETKKYLESHPELAERLQRVSKAYKIFGDYLRLTQTRIIIRESGASNAEADLSAALSRANC